MIPWSNPHAQYLSHREEIDAAIRGVLDKGIFIHGPECSALERDFSAWVGVSHGIGVSNGTEAVALALLALGLRPGDEVVTVSHTATATVAAIELARCVPVLVDVEPESLTMDPQVLDAAIGPKCRAVIAVHLYGQACDMDAIGAICRRRGVALVEDCAQAHGARWKGKAVGSFGDIACFSFYPTKNLGALGDGGMVVTSRSELAEKCRMLREYGWKERFVADFPGWNSRLDEMQAACLRVKLRHLDRDNERRRGVAARYGQGLANFGLKLPPSRPEVQPVFHLYVVRTAARDELKKHLHGAGVGTGIHYPVPVHRQPAYHGRVRTHGDLKVTDRAVAEILSLPIYPELAPSDTDAVIAAVGTWAKRR